MNAALINTFFFQITIKVLVSLAILAVCIFLQPLSIKPNLPNQTQQSTQGGLSPDWFTMGPSSLEQWVSFSVWRKCAVHKWEWERDSMECQKGRLRRKQRESYWIQMLRKVRSLVKFLWHCIWTPDIVHKVR